MGGKKGNRSDRSFYQKIQYIFCIYIFFFIIADTYMREIIEENKS